MSLCSGSCKEVTVDMSSYFFSIMVKQNKELNNGPKTNTGHKEKSQYRKNISSKLIKPVWLKSNFFEEVKRKLGFFSLRRFLFTFFKKISCIFQLNGQLDVSKQPILTLCGLMGNWIAIIQTFKYSLNSN